MKPAHCALIVPAGLLSLGSGAGAQMFTPQPAPVDAPKASEAKPADPDTIISDADFDKALPSLEDKPAPITAPVPAPAKTPVLVPVTNAQTAPPVTATETGDIAPDPALQVAPETFLGDLESFNAEPLNTTSTTPDATGVLIDYDYAVTGLEGLKDLEKTFEDLSALKAGKGKAANVTMIRVRANADEEMMLRMLQSAGYYDARARTTIRPKSERAGRLEAVMRVTPGKPYYVGDVTFDLPDEGNYALPPGLLRRELRVNSGDPLRADHILAAEAQLSVTLPQNGYPFSKLEGRDIELDPTTLEADYTLNLDPGPKSVFGDIVSDTDKPFKIKHIREMARFERGQMYDQRLTEDLHQALSSTGLYRSVNAEPILSEQKTAEGSTIVNIRVHQEAGKPRTLAAEAGYATGEGYHTTLSWTHRNLYPPEGALILSASAGNLKQSVSSIFRRTNAGQRDRTLQAGLALLHNRLDTYEGYGVGLNATLSRLSTPIWQKVWTWSVGAEVLAAHEQAFNTQIQSVEWRDYVLLSVPMKLNYDRSDNLLNPQKGYRMGVQLSPQVSLKSSAASNARVIFDASVYHPLTRRITLAARTRLGLLGGGTLNDIAPSQRLYAGGGGSVRGFGYQALGPVDVTNAPTGGRSLTEASIELRYRVGDFGLVPFLDAGQVYEGTAPRLNKLRLGAGIGARYYTSFGPLRIDLATPLNRRTGDASVAIYVGIGQTF